MSIEKKIQTEYEALLNELAYFSIEDTFYVIWAIENNLQFNIPLPSDIETPKEFDPTLDRQYRRIKFIPEWELEFLLLYSTVKNTKLVTPYSLRTFSNLAHIINRIRIINNLLEEKHLSPSKIVLKELFRIAHRQFKWQELINTHHIYRYYKIFNHATIRAILKEEFGFNTHDLLMTGLLVFNGFIKAPITILPVKSEIDFISNEMVSKFFDLFSYKLESTNKLIGQLPDLNEQLFYNFNPLQKYPIIISGSKAFCPITTHLLWRITNGLYYDLKNKKGFDQAFGESFQEFTGEVLRKTLTNNYLIQPEFVYSKPEKRTSDWIITKDDTTVFIECKTKRLKIGSKTQLINDDDIQDDIKLMAKFIFQGYKAINDILNNCLPELSINSKSSTYLVISTLEDWFIYLCSEFEHLLETEIRSLFQKSSLSEALIKEIPFSILSIGQIERHFQVINSYGFKEYFTRLSNNNLNEITENFYYKQLFIKEFQEMFPSKT